MPVDDKAAITACGTNGVGIYSHPCTFHENAVNPSSETVDSNGRGLTVRLFDEAASSPRVASFGQT